MVKELREHINEISGNKSIFYYHMAQAVLKFKPPLNIFGHIVGEESQADELNLDIKKVIFPIITFIRLYSISEKLTQTNSLERLSELFSRKSIDKTSHEELDQAYNFLMHIRLDFQVESITQNEIPNNIVNINKLTRIEVATLKKLFSDMGNIQSKVSFDFKGGE
jgi:CBS domain-containing protein